MKQFHYLSKQEQQRIKSHFFSLVQMAYADGHLDMSELKFLRDQGQKYGLPDQELADILNKPVQQTDLINKYTDPYNRIELFYDLVRIMLIDHKLKAEEVSLCMKFAKMLNVDTGMIPYLVNTIQQHVQEGKGLDDLIDEFYDKF